MPASLPSNDNPRPFPLPLAPKTLNPKPYKTPAQVTADQEQAEKVKKVVSAEERDVKAMQAETQVGGRAVVVCGGGGAGRVYALGAHMAGPPS